MVGNNSRQNRLVRNGQDLANLDVKEDGGGIFGKPGWMKGIHKDFCSICGLVVGKKQQKKAPSDWDSLSLIPKELYPNSSEY